jgi:purine nucleosidase
MPAVSRSSSRATDVPIRIILDTDIGSDIDDAVALAWLLARGDCEIVGITTVSGEPEQRARIASALCRAAGREIAIYPGLAAPLRGPQRQPTAPQAAALPRWLHQASYPADSAISFLRDSARSSPGELTLLSIGPLTNIAALLAADPDAAGMFHRVVSMVGAFDRPAASGRPQEWNALCDPEALDAVLRAPIADHLIVPLDATMPLSLPAAEVRARFQHPRLSSVLDFAETWFARSDRLVFHDPLAALVLLDPEVCGWRRGRCDVDASGRTHWRDDPAGRHRAAFTVDAGRFFRGFFDVFT